MEKPMFVFAGTYSNVASAEGDYEVIKLLHSCDEIGSYDAAVIARVSGGEVALHKATLPSDAGGAGLEAWIEELAGGLSQADAEEMRSLLEADRAALVVVGIEADATRIEQSAVEATRSMLSRAGQPPR